MKQPAAPQTDTQPRHTTWLQRTGQKRIAIFWLGVFGVSCLMLLLPFLGLPFHKIFGTDARWENMLFIIWPIGVCMLTLLGLVLTLRCPRCKLKIVFFAISKLPSDKWFDYLLVMQECPRCGYTGFAPDEATEQHTAGNLQQELTTVEQKPKPRLLTFTAWINGLIIWGLMFLSIGRILLVEPKWVYTFRVLVDLLIVGVVYYVGDSVLKAKKWALVPLYGLYIANVLLIGYKLFSSAILHDKAAVAGEVAFWSAWAIVSIGWSLLSVHVLSFKYGKLLTWW